MNLNPGQAGWLKKLAAREGFGLAFDPVLAPGNDGDRTALAYRLSGRALAAAVKPLSGRAAPALVPGPATAAPAPDLLCGAGRNVCAVGPDGTLYPCLQVPVRLGNLASRPFSGIWKNAPWLKRWRAAGLKNLKGCAGCADLDFCSRCPGISLLETGDIHAPNKPACALAALTRERVEKDSTQSQQSSP